MKSAAILDLARRLKRDAFVARFKTLFLAVKVDQGHDEEEEDSGEIGFNTEVVAFEQGEGEAARWEVLELAKAAGNPYPDRISVGRARNCDIVMRESTVSKLHAHFRTREGGFDLVDLESQNGTRVGGTPLPAHQPRIVELGDVIHFGIVATLLVDAARLYDLLHAD